MSDVGGGIMLEAAEDHWAHGVSTHELGAGHMLCALVVEYRAPVTFTAVVKHLCEKWASGSSSHQQSPIMLDKINPVPDQWAPSSKSTISKLLGEFVKVHVYIAGCMCGSHGAWVVTGFGVWCVCCAGGLGGAASAVSCIGQALTSARAALKKGLGLELDDVEKKALEDRARSGGCVCVGCGVLIEVC